MPLVAPVTSAALPFSDSDMVSTPVHCGRMAYGKDAYTFPSQAQPATRWQETVPSVKQPHRQAGCASPTLLAAFAPGLVVCCSPESSLHYPPRARPHATTSPSLA